MIIIGIDNGLNGGIAFLDENETIRGIFTMPVTKYKKTEYNISAIVNMIKLMQNVEKDIKAIIEKAHVRPISGKKACFVNGFGYGLIQGILSSLSISYEIVTPNEWMKTILKGYNTKNEKASVQYCLKKYPHHTFTSTLKSTKPHDGQTDAVCIALWGLRNMKGMLNE